MGAMTHTITDEQIDAILDSPGNLDYVIADKRQRLHLFARRVLELRPADDADLMSEDLLDFVRRMQDWHAGRVHYVKEIQEAVKEGTTLQCVNSIDTNKKEFELNAREAIIFVMGLEAGLGCFDSLPFRLECRNADKEAGV